MLGLAPLFPSHFFSHGQDHLLRLLAGRIHQGMGLTKPVMAYRALQGLIGALRAFKALISALRPS